MSEQQPSHHHNHHHDHHSGTEGLNFNPNIYYNVPSTMRREIIIPEHYTSSLQQLLTHHDGSNAEDLQQVDDVDNFDQQIAPPPQHEFRLKITCVMSGMIIFASFGLPLLVLCGLYASLIQGGPTSVQDDQAMVIPLSQPCIIEKIWINCFVRQYTRVCYYQVGFNSSSSLWSVHDGSRVVVVDSTIMLKSMVTSPAYDIFKEPFKSLRVNDTVLCYVNRNVTKISIVEPSSEVFDRYQIITILMGVFGGICCTFSLCSWVAIFAKSR